MNARLPSRPLARGALGWLALGAIVLAAGPRSDARAQEEALAAECAAPRFQLQLMTPLAGTIPRDAPTEEATLKYFLSELVPGANAESEPE